MVYLHTEVDHTSPLSSIAVSHHWTQLTSYNWSGRPKGMPMSVIQRYLTLSAA
jgi:hypothetical protein